MDAPATIKRSRRPRFRRAPEPPPFRLTDDDVAIVRHLARYRFLRSTHIAALVGRSLDRTNDRLHLLYHAGYVDRPRAQLEFYPVGSAPMVYALADRGARLLIERDGFELAHVEWSRKNFEARRPFIEHQLELVDFIVAVQCAPAARSDVCLLSQSDIIASLPESTRKTGNPLAMKVKLSRDGAVHQVGVVPDTAFGLKFPDGSRRCFMVEIDRGTMPVERKNPKLTSYQRKMHAYLGAHAAKLHERQFGWKTFRVLTVTTDEHRLRSMMDALRALHVPHSLGPQLFLFATRSDLRAPDPLTHGWLDGSGRTFQLI